MPAEIRDALGDRRRSARCAASILQPDVSDAFDVTSSPEPDVAGILRFLCEEREFSRDRVQAALDRAFGVSGARLLQKSLSTYRKS